MFNLSPAVTPSGNFISTFEVSILPSLAFSGLFSIPSLVSLGFVGFGVYPTTFLSSTNVTIGASGAIVSVVTVSLPSPPLFPA